MHPRRTGTPDSIDLGDTRESALSSIRAAEEPRHRKKSDGKWSPATPITPPVEEIKAALRMRTSVLKYCHKHVWLPSLILILFVGITYVLAARNNPDHWLWSMVLLSYPVEGTSPTLYGKGGRDFAFVFFYMAVFIFFREFIMQVLLEPLGRYLGLRSRHKLNRFLEQSYAMLYYGITGPAGLYIMKYHSPTWYFNTRAFYEGFPHRELDAWFKSFYLLQAAFWSQQAIVLMLNLEKRRRDFRELVFHHAVTIALIWLSYRFHFTYIGLAIYITMDVSDFFLAFSKCLNYFGSDWEGFFYAIFVSCWIYMRHYLNIKVLWSILTEFRTVGPFELNWETQQYKCWISQPITFSLLLALQLVNLYWLALILRIGFRYVFYSEKSDVRSDAEDDEDIVAADNKSKTD